MTNPFPEFQPGRDKLKTHAGALLLYAALAVLFSWPLALKFYTHFIDATEYGLPVRDAAQHHWNLWWVKHALLNLHTNPYSCDYLFAPQGTPLALHTLCMLYGIISIPLQLFLPINAIYNLILLSGFIFAGHSAWLLARSLGANQQGALLAGIIFSFFHFRTDSIMHLNIFSTQWIPYCLWAWFGLLNFGTKRWWFWVAIFQSCFFLVSLNLLYITVMAQALILIWCLRRLNIQRDGKGWPVPKLKWVSIAVFIICWITINFSYRITLWFPLFLLLVLAAVRRIALSDLLLLFKRITPAILVTILFCGIFIAMMLNANKGHEYSRSPLSAQIAMGADAMNYFVPHYLYDTLKQPMSEFVQSNTGRIYSTKTWKFYQLERSQLFFGISVYLMLALALIRKPSSLRNGWLLIALFFAMLSLGPSLKIFNMIQFGDRSIFLPGTAIRLLPGGETMRATFRFFIIAHLAVAIMIGLNWETVLQRLKLQKISWFAFSIFGLLVILEQHPGGIKMNRWQPPQFLQTISQYEKPLTVWHWQQFDQKWSGWNMAAQTQHQRPITDGYVSRQTNKLAALSDQRPWPNLNQEGLILIVNRIQFERKLAMQALRHQDHWQANGFKEIQIGDFSIWTREPELLRQIEK